MAVRGASRGPKAVPAFKVQASLNSSGMAKTIVARQGDVLFTQGDACEDVLYVQTGGVKLSVMSKSGREGVVAMLGTGDFFGEGCLVGKQVRIASATAIAPSVILLVRKDRMARLLQQDHAMSDWFISHLLSRNIRMEDDLVDHLVNSSEKRLARALLLMANYGPQGEPARVPKISQQTLAEIVGTTRQRVNFFMKKFQRLGFIDYSRGLTVNRSLSTVVLHN